MSDVPDDIAEKAEALIDAFYEPLDLDNIAWLDRYGERLISSIAAALIAEREAQRERDAQIVETRGPATQDMGEHVRMRCARCRGSRYPFS